MKTRRLVLAGLALLAVSGSVAVGMSAAASSTIVVDASGGPGATFTALQPAINAAQPGDLILVRPGTYGNFSMSKPLKILGEEGARVNNGVIQGVGGLTLLADLEFRDLIIRNSSGTVVLDRLWGWNTSLKAQAQILVNNCDDVRMYQLDQSFGGGNGKRPQIIVRASRVEITLSSLEGNRGADSSQVFGYADAGGDAIVVEQDGYLHLTRSQVAGGRGGNGTHPFSGYGGDGGTALEIEAGEVLITGRGVELIEGGRGGNGGGSGQLGYGGSGGDGIAVSSTSAVRYSGVLPTSGSGGMVNGGSGKALDAAPGSGVKQPNFGDPSLEHLGEPLPGATLTVKLRSRPGTYSRLFWGTTPTVQPSAGVLVDKLVVKEATIPIGIVPASGVLTTPFVIDPSLPPGSTIFLQAMSIFPSGKIRRTNSVPIVVR